MTLNYKKNIEIPTIKYCDSMKSGDSIKIADSNGEAIPYLSFSKLDALPGIKHFFSTRLGGVSTGDQASLNFSYKMDSSENNVRENFKIAASILDVDVNGIVGGDQTHTAVVKVVDSLDAGNAVMKPKSFFDVDGLVTNDPNITLFVTCADCVPILLADPVKKVVGAVHSGWKGTCNGIAGNAVKIMKENFGSSSSDIVAAIGPSICSDCYEVSEDLLEAFSDSGIYSKKEIDDIFVRGHMSNGEQKYQLDLWKANEFVLKNAGLSSDNIETTHLCTCCNPEVLFSHRATKGKRGGMGAFITIEK